MSPNNNSWRLSLLWVHRKWRTQGRFGCELVCVFCCHKTHNLYWRTDRNVEGKSRRRSFSAFLEYSQMSEVVYDKIIRGLSFLYALWCSLVVVTSCTSSLIDVFVFCVFFFCSCCFSFCSSHYPKSKSAENCLCIAEPSWKTNKTCLSMLYSLMREAWFVAIKARTAFNLYCTPV